MVANAATTPAMTRHALPVTFVLFSSWRIRDW
jgi:hypothetical protein